ncbi:MAG: hypothetical protein JRF50_14850, partial [Deltaproteobacteria bacterium]|nr:hypothetical protein [Deltaproteobacteria bacterium]
MKMKTGRILCALFLITTLTFITLALSPAFGAGGEEKNDTRPERGISVAFEYPGVVINKGD